jgi:hypothetical protein
MQIALSDALAQLDLKPGKTYRCHVKGQWVELRVLDKSPPSLAKPYSEADVMLDPWVELPGPTVSVKVTAKPGAQLPFDIPSIPEDA